jgi:1,4-dihydroxy-2-naphthoyl-CoA hydrolase
LGGRVVAEESGSVPGVVAGEVIRSARAKDAGRISPSDSTNGRGGREPTMLNDDPLPFAKLLGLELVSVTPDRVEARLRVRDELCTRPAVLHGGAVMAFADTLGALATVANLPEGATTTTVESKTNFFAAVPAGDTATAECTPLHRGRTTMVWQTKISREDGRLAALVIQTQLVLPSSR